MRTVAATKHAKVTGDMLRLPLKHQLTRYCRHPCAGEGPEHEGPTKLPRFANDGTEARVAGACFGMNVRV